MSMSYPYRSVGTQVAHVLVYPKSKALSATPSRSLTDVLSDLDETQNWSFVKWGMRPCNPVSEVK